MLAHGALGVTISGFESARWTIGCIRVHAIHQIPLDTELNQGALVMMGRVRSDRKRACMPIHKGENLEAPSPVSFHGLGLPGPSRSYLGTSLVFRLLSPCYRRRKLQRAPRPFLQNTVVRDRFVKTCRWNPQGGSRDILVI